MSEQPKINGEYRDEKGRFVQGNPGGGKPPGSFSLVAILKKKLQECPLGEDKRTYAERIVEQMLKDAVARGDDKQRKMILQYVEGMPKQQVDVTSDGLPFVINVQKHDGKREDS